MAASSISGIDCGIRRSPWNCFNPQIYRCEGWRIYPSRGLGQMANRLNFSMSPPGTTFPPALWPKCGGCCPPPSKSRPWRLVSGAFSACGERAVPERSDPEPSLPPSHGLGGTSHGLIAHTPPIGWRAITTVPSLAAGASVLMLSTSSRARFASCAIPYGTTRSFTSMDPNVGLRR